MAFYTFIQQLIMLYKSLGSIICIIYGTSLYNIKNSIYFYVIQKYKH